MTSTVIGGAGFVGARLVQALEAQGRRPYVPQRDDADLLSADLGVVFYCAGLTADYDRRPFDTVEAHASFVSRLIATGRFERLVYLSSTRLYDGQAVGDEDQPLRLDPRSPRHVYDLSKALGENLTLTRTDGRGSVARLSNVYDWRPGAPGFLSEWLVRAGMEQRIALQSSPHIRRDYIHLDDVVAALLAIAQADPPGIVNVASGELVSNAAIAEVFAEKGWAVSFTDDADPAPPPNAPVERLTALGVNPRPVRKVVASYLEGLKA